MGIAEFAILADLEFFRVFLFILGSCIVTLLALCAGQSNSDSHDLDTSILSAKYLEYSITRAVSLSIKERMYQAVRWLSRGSTPAAQIDD